MSFSQQMRALLETTDPAKVAALQAERAAMKAENAMDTAKDEASYNAMLPGLIRAWRAAARAWATVDAAAPLGGEKYIAGTKKDKAEKAVKEWSAVAKEAGVAVTEAKRPPTSEVKDDLHAIVAQLKDMAYHLYAADGTETPAELLVAVREDAETVKRLLGLAHNLALFQLNPKLKKLGQTAKQTPHLPLQPLRRVNTDVDDLIAALDTLKVEQG